ncbi:hypothetical protein QSH57_004724 [Fusarium oxysporum f. sp. vasinfectum]|nr:hypothetical protein QSH57_004724 [Fusarium oxysporum f. sp. vasinfectum]
MAEQQREDGSSDKREAQEEAEEEATSMFRIIREKVQRFMTVTSGNAKAEPTPMDWIYEAPPPSAIPDRRVNGDVAFVEGRSTRVINNIDHGGQCQPVTADPVVVIRR